VHFRTDISRFSFLRELNESFEVYRFKSSEGIEPPIRTSGPSARKRKPKGKTMKFSLTLAAAALAASVAVPAFAADSTQFAIQHFNQSADTSSDRISVGPNGPALCTTVASMGDDAIGVAVRNFNASIDSAADRVNSETVTVFSGEPAYAADIFEQLRLADDTN